MPAGGDLPAMLQKAALLLRAGRLDEAEVAYVQLLARYPDLPDSWYNLARLQRRAGRFESALASYQQALDRNVSRPEEVHLNRAVIYSDCLRRDDAAESELNAALVLNPAYTPALLNLANLREDHGRREDALALYERILAREPRNAEALARYANLKPVDSPHDPLVRLVQGAMAAPGTTDAARASLGFALGRMLDAAGAYDAAFDAYVAANRSSQASAGRVAPLYDRHQHELFVDELIATFAKAIPVTPAANTSVRPIFICGMFRSGSTLVEQVLAAHSRVTAGGELGYLPAMVRKDLAPFPAGMARLEESRREHLASSYLETLSRLFPGADRVTDKRPDNFLYIGLIKRLFPDARIIHTTRDPLDNCLSIFFLHLDHSMGYALDLMDTAHYYREYRRLMAHWKALHGPDILDFSYDAFVRDPRPPLQRLLEFCGLDWQEACMSFERARGAVKTASVWQVRQPLYQRSSGRWRNYAHRLAPLRQFMSDNRLHGPEESE